MAIQDHMGNFVNRIFLFKSALDVDRSLAMAAPYLPAKTFARPDIQYGKQAVWKTGALSCDGHGRGAPHQPDFSSSVNRFGIGWVPTQICTHCRMENR